MNANESIAEFFSDRTVFLTGATGYVGKGVVEKLLRSCPSIKTIYVLVRCKKGTSAQDRVSNSLKSPIFNLIKKDAPELLKKVIAIPGDIESPFLGISDSDLSMIIAEVTVILHIAATIKFTEHLKIAMNVNVKATQEILKIGKMIPNIASIIHVSTAYANCDRTEVEEKIYKMKENPQNMLKVIDILDDEIVDLITPKLISPRPNTYTFTKALAEQIVLEESENLPISIVRPSIIMSTWKEPFPGFVDNLTGINGFIAGGLKGILKAIYIKSDNKGDVIPLDIVVNTIIAAAWKTAISRGDSIRIYHACTGYANSPSWKFGMNVGKEYGQSFKVKNSISTTNVTFYNNWILYRIANFFYHYLPCYIMDIFDVIKGRPPRMVKLYEKMNKGVKTLHYFMNNEWKFDIKETQSFFKSLSPSDQNNFNFDVKSINWRNFFINSVYGIQTFVLKDDFFKSPPIPQHLLHETCGPLNSFIVENKKNH